MCDKQKMLDDFLNIIGLIEDDKIECCSELYDRLCSLYDEIKSEPESYDEGPAYEDKYDI